jgi:hypothetical protein
MEWTDWSPLRGRRVLIWPDCDEAGIQNARKLAKRLALMGGIIEYVNWSVEDIRRYPGWDWADDGGFSDIGEGEIRARTMLVESPVGPDGRISSEWARRSFLDPRRLEVYQVSDGYQATPLNALATDKGKAFRADLVASSINEFKGLDYRPGIPMGRMADGRINTCPPTARDALVPRPFNRAMYRELRNVWLRHMIPDRRERKHLIKRAAWAVARPDRTPQHIVVMQGDSGIGKSVMLDLIVAVSGRGVSLFPNSIFTTFNNLIARRSVVAVHEIHAPHERQKEIAGKLKELIANSTIEIEEKNRPKISVTNVIHWFAATNEKNPFALEHGNDRFYFVKCGNPPDPVRMRRFFRKWVPIFKQEAFLDELNAGAKWLVEGFSKTTQQEMQGRALPQSVWARMTRESMKPWEKFLLRKLEELTAPEFAMTEDGQQVLDDKGQPVLEKEDHPVAFSADNLERLVLKHHPRGVGLPFELRPKMNEFGYFLLRRPNGTHVAQRVGKDQKTNVWCRKADADKWVARWRESGGYGKLTLRNLPEGDG